MLPKSIPIGPLFQLRYLHYLGLICPCFQDDEVARNALLQLTDIPVRYHRKTKGEASASASISSAVSGLFGGGGSSGGGGGEESSTFVKSTATLTLIDTLSGPAIFIETEPDESLETNEVDEEGNVVDVDTRHRKRVPLKKIGTIKAVEGRFLGMGGGPSLVGVYGHGDPRVKDSGAELLRFNVLNAAGKKTESAERRDEAIQKLRALVEWDRRRRESSGEQDDDTNDEEEVEFENDEEVGGKRRGAPKGRAAKAAYFAKREIELTKQRREREKRKARYLEGGGGLKYTAIAMANKAEMT